LKIVVQRSQMEVHLLMNEWQFLLCRQGQLWSAYPMWAGDRLYLQAELSDWME